MITTDLDQPKGKPLVKFHPFILLPKTHPAFYHQHLWVFADVIHQS